MLTLAQEASEAAALLECAAGFVEQGWCKEANARTATRAPTSPESPNATCWCAAGAIHAASHVQGCHTHQYGVSDPTLTGAEKQRNGRIINRARQALYWYITEEEGWAPATGATIVGWNDVWAANGAQVARGMRGAAARLRQEAAA